MQAKISNSLIKTLLPGEKVYDVRDLHLKGFLIRVHPSGGMSYVCQYKRGRRVNLGRVGVMTAAQAREKAIEVLSNINKGIEPKVQKGINKPKTLQEFIEKEYKPWVLSHHKRGEETLATLTRCFNKFFPKPLTEIAPSILEQWRIKRSNDGISNVTLNRNIATLKSVMTKASEWGFLKENPLKSLRLFKIDRSPKVRYLSLEEERRLRQVLLARETQLKQERKSANQWRNERGYPLFPEVADHECCDYLMPMIVLSINTGLRQGELFNLSWDMVNLSEGSLIVSGNITKNSSSRYIPLNEEAHDMIKQLYNKSANKEGLVFPSKNNQPFNNVKRSWSSVLKKAQITQFRWHDLRHHFASRLVMAGVDLNTVRELLGHSDITMTLRYAHLAPEHKINAVRKIKWSTAAMENYS
ncbi:MAG: site-specific integrase [Gammaproteobacteria bacterium]|nr:site-specific integrase [Gammaproteobacteria bacterium]